MSLDEILNMLGARTRQLQAMGVRELAVFGSAASGTARDDSDLDFLVELDRNTFDAYMDLKLFLEDLFGRRVDLVLKHTIKPRLKSGIEKSAVHAPGF